MLLHGVAAGYLHLPNRGRRLAPPPLCVYQHKKPTPFKIWKAQKESLLSLNKEQKDAAESLCHVVRCQAGPGILHTRPVRTSLTAWNVTQCMLFHLPSLFLPTTMQALARPEC